MKTTFKIMISLVLAMLSVASAGAWTGVVGLNKGEVVGGNIEFYPFYNPNFDKIYTVNYDPNGTYFYVRLLPDDFHTITGITEADITAVVTTTADQAEARSVTRSGGTTPNVGITCNVFFNANYPGWADIYIPENLNLEDCNITVSVKYPDKPYDEKVPYIDADGQQKTTPEGVKVYTLDGSETRLGRIGNDTNGQPYTTWYISKTSGEGLVYNHEMAISGDVRLILADGSKMTVDNPSGVYGFSNNYDRALFIYGQGGVDSSTGQSLEGTLNVSSNYNGFYLDCPVTICGGNINVSGPYYGINTSNKVYIYGGNVNATATTPDANYGNGINGSNGVYIYGGKVNATGNNSGITTGSSDITLGWRNPDDFINASSYDRQVTIADGQRFVAYTVSGTTETASAIVSGTVSDNNTINGKILRPLDGHVVKITAEKGVGIVGTNGPDFTLDGYFYYAVGNVQTVQLISYSSDIVHLDLGTGGPTLNAVDNLPLQRSFTMPDADVTIDVVKQVLDVNKDGLTYDGDPKFPTIKFDNVELVAGTDFNYFVGGNTNPNPDCIDARDYDYNVIGLGNYVGQTIGTVFTINPKSVTPSAAVSGTYTFTGAALTPTLAVTADNAMVDADSYTVTWQKKNSNGGYDDVGSVLYSGVYRAKVSNSNTGNYTISADTYSNDFTVSPAILSSVDYIDVVNGQLTEATATNVTVLEGNETKLTAGTYVALKKLGDVELPHGINNGIAINGNVSIILGTDVGLTITNYSGWAICGSNTDGSPATNDNLTIYGQRSIGGSLNLKGHDGGIYVNNLNLVTGTVTNLTGGVCAFKTTGDMTMLNGYNTGSIVSNGNVSILGGNYVAIYNSSGIQCGSGNTITLGWLNAETDFVVAPSYTGTVKTVDGQRFMAYDNSSTPQTAVGIVSGTVTDNSTIASKILRPFQGHVVKITDETDVNIVDKDEPDFTEGGYDCYTVATGATVTLSTSSDTFSHLDVNSGGPTLNAVDNMPLRRSFTMPDADVTIDVVKQVLDINSSGLTYDGTPKFPTIKFDNVELVAGTDFNYFVGGNTNPNPDCIDARDYYYYVIGLGNYVGQTIGTVFKINRKPVTPSVSVSGTYTFTGEALTPAVLVKDGTVDIDTDSYFLSWQKKNAGGYYDRVDEVLHSGDYRAVVCQTNSGNYHLNEQFNFAYFTVAPAVIDNVSYVDVVNGQLETKTANNVTVLEGNETKLTEGTYVALKKLGDVSLSLRQYTGIAISGDVKIILGDGVEMTVYSQTGWGVCGSGNEGLPTANDNLTIYGQSGQSGYLTLSGGTGGIYVNKLNIVGGIISGGASNQGAFITTDDFTMRYGLVDGSIVSAGNVSLLGGVYSGIPANYTVECGSGKTITLGWRDAQYDHFYAKSFTGTVKTVSGQRFMAYDHNTTPNTPVGLVSGTLTDNSAVNDKILRPYVGNVVAIPTGANLAVINDDATATTVGSNVVYNVATGETVKLSYTGTSMVTLGGLPTGQTFGAVDGQPMQRTFTMPAEDVYLTVSATTIQIEDVALTYDGEPKAPRFKFDDVQKTAGTDYTIAFAQGSTALTAAVNAGQYAATLTGLGQYVGTRGSESFTIMPKQVTPSVRVTGNYTFTNQALSPTLEVKDGDDVIAPSEYSVSWQMADYNGVFNDVSSVLHSGLYHPVLNDNAGGNYIVGDNGFTAIFTVSPAKVSSVAYVDVVDGTLVDATAENVTVLEGHETRLGPGTYVALQSYNNAALDLTKYERIATLGDVTIILSDGVTMQATNQGGYCILDGVPDDNGDYDDALTIYGQSAQNGVLRLNGSQGGIYVGSIDIYGGQVSGTHGAYGAFNTDGDFTLHYGVVTGSISSSGNVNLLGGMCAAYQDNDVVHCGSGKTITLGWLDSERDYIRVNRFDGTVRTAEGKYFTANDYVNQSYVPTCTVSGTVSDLSTINGKMLRPVLGFAVRIAPGEFATYFSDTAVALSDSETEAALFTVSNVSDSEVTLSPVNAAPAQTPLIVYNSGATTRDIVLTISNEPTTAPQVYSGFKGTLTDATIPASTPSTARYALNGLAFVYVKNSIPVTAHHCWLEVGASEARTLRITFGDATGIAGLTNGADGANGSSEDGAFYDLRGRRLSTAPTRPGVYIRNGAKVVIR